MHILRGFSIYNLINGATIKKPSYTRCDLDDVTLGSSAIISTGDIL